MTKGEISETPFASDSGFASSSPTYRIIITKVGDRLVRYVFNSGQGLVVEKLPDLVQSDHLKSGHRAKGKIKGKRRSSRHDGSLVFVPSH